MSKPNQTAVAYLRVSTDEQATEGVSLAAQERAIRAYCAFRGLELVELVIDAGVSAGKPLASREGGARVLELVKAGTVGAVVAYKLDRVFRDCADCLTVTRAWDVAGVALHLIDLGGQAVDTSSAMGRFFLTVMAGAAELERNQIRERTTLAMSHKRAAGERVGAVRFGFRLAADGEHSGKCEGACEGCRNLTEYPAEQRVLVLIRDYRNAGLSFRAIAERLDVAAPEVARGARWHTTTVARLVKVAA